MRGLHKVRGQWSLVCMAWNLKRMAGLTKIWTSKEIAVKGDQNRSRSSPFAYFLATLEVARILFAQALHAARAHKYEAFATFSKRLSKGLAQVKNRLVVTTGGIQFRGASCEFRDCFGIDNRT